MMHRAAIDETATWLAMDTSTSTMTLAVMRGNEVLGESDSDAERNHSIKLLPAVQELMHSLQLSMKDLDGVTVGQGPGSYTGVRIGVTVAKTFAWSLNIPLVAVSSLEALAYGGWRQNSRVGLADAGTGLAAGDAGAEDEGNTGTASGAGTVNRVKTWIVPLMDARRGQAYTALYGFDGTRWSGLVSDSIRLMGDWLTELAEMLRGMGVSEEAAAGFTEGSDENSNEDNSSVSLLWKPERILFVGETGLFKEMIEQEAGAFSVKADVQTTLVKAYDAAMLGKQKWTRGETEDAHSFVPNYTQLAEAEKNWLAKQ